MKRIIFAIVILVVSAEVHLLMIGAISSALPPPRFPAALVLLLSMFVVAWLGAWVFRRWSGLRWSGQVALFWIVSLAVQFVAGLVEAMKTPFP